AVETGDDSDAVMARALAGGANLRRVSQRVVGVSLDETTTDEDVQDLLSWFAAPGQTLPAVADLAAGAQPMIPLELQRSSPYLTHPVFNAHHSETEMLPITWPEFACTHPFAPPDQLEGWHLLEQQLCGWLCEATGYSGVSLQPNAGSQGEYAGLLAIRAWHASRGELHRDVCLIPESAHGTNPASAQMAGMTVVVTRCDAAGNVDLDDLRAKCEQHGPRLAAVMITYPSTHGVFESRIGELCELVHRHGGRVYVDGANM
ncbi:MAG: hypothetical protein JNK57_22635, partial [Planctomycetaceae bacterium]|nr:hypothetical protein [Planctomycetaceae bacterium]